MGSQQRFETALRAWAAIFLRRSVHEFILAMKDSGLSASQVNTLMRLHYRGPCPVTGIGDDLGLTPAAASQIVDRLVSMHLIERTEDPRDRRVKQVALTPQGRRLVGRGIEARLGWIREITGRIEPNEMAATVAALERLTRAANALEREALPAGASSRANA